MTQRGSIIPHEAFNKRSSNRVSEEFVYRQSLQRHIGKRTGNLYRRLYYKQNFDGFPRFSQYQSHHLTQLSSLAKSFQFDSQLEDSFQKDTKVDNFRQKCVIQANKRENNETKRQNKTQIPENSAQRKQIFGIEQFFSTIKKYKSSQRLRESQIKDYNQLIQKMENNEPQQFQFDQQGVMQLVQALVIDAQSKQIQQAEKQKQLNKNIKRVSFNFSQEQKAINFQQRLTPQLQNIISCQINRAVTYEKCQGQERQQQRHEKIIIKQINNKKMEKDQKNKRKSRESKRRRTNEQIQELAGMKCGSKYCILSQQKQYLKQLYSQEKEKKRNERYPKRTRMRPVQYWQNQKVQYKKGKAIRIQRSTLNMRQLICTNQGYQNKISINFSTHNIEIQVRIPPKKQLRSAGICDLYQRLEISLCHKIQTSQVYYEDHLRKQQLIYQQHTDVPIFTQFLISNFSRKTVNILIKMIIKNI